MTLKKERNGFVRFTDNWRKCEDGWGNSWDHSLWPLSDASDLGRLDVACGRWNGSLSSRFIFRIVGQVRSTETRACRVYPKVTILEYCRFHRWSFSVAMTTKSRTNTAFPVNSAKQWSVWRTGKDMWYVSWCQEKRSFSSVVSERLCRCSSTRRPSSTDIDSMWILRRARLQWRLGSTSGRQREISFGFRELTNNLTDRCVSLSRNVVSRIIDGISEICRGLERKCAWVFVIHPVCLDVLNKKAETISFHVNPVIKRFPWRVSKHIRFGSWATFVSHSSVFLSFRRNAELNKTLHSSHR